MERVMQLNAENAGDLEHSLEHVGPDIGATSTVESM